MGKTEKTEMPKKKRTTRQTTKRSTNNMSNVKENSHKSKKSNKKPSPNEAITMSKQLLATKNKRLKRRVNTKSTKVCPNGKPMPTLADLEKMFEDSDTEDKGQKDLVISTLDEPKTPVSDAKTTRENKLLSPGTIRNIADHLMDIITKEPAEVLAQLPLPPDLPSPGDASPGPVIPPKKRKKSEVPYIVGCKERPRISEKPTTNFCNSSTAVDEEEHCPTKRRKRSTIGGFSKSIFNAQSEDIAERLKAIEDNVHSDDSNDSNKTEIYRLSMNNQPGSPFERFTFSPLPSTSRDNETFIKNDQLFCESLTVNSTTINNTKKHDDTDVEIIEVPCETIIINDEKPQNTVRETNHDSCIEIIEVKNDTIHKPLDSVNIDDDDDDDDCILVDDTIAVSNKKKNDNKPTTVPEYSECTIVETESNFKDEIIDVDDLIEQNKAIIQKIQVKSQYQSVIEVIDCSPCPNSQQKPSESTSGIQNSSRNENISINDHRNTNTNYMNNETIAEVNTTINSVPIPNETNADRISQMLHVFVRNYNVNNVPQRYGNFQNMLPGNFNMNTARSRTQPQNNYLETINHTSGNFYTRDNTQVVHSLPNAITSTISPINPYNSNNMRLPTQPARNYTDMSVSNLSRNLAYTQFFNPGHNINPYSSINMERSIGLTQPMRHYTEANRLVNPSTTKSSKDSQETIVNPPALPEKSNERNLGDCPICMDSLSRIAIASTICGHVFCLKCIQAAVRASGKRCPTCRKVLKGAGFHQLYL